MKHVNLPCIDMDLAKVGCPARGFFSVILVALPWLLHVFCDVWIAEAATSIVAVLAATGNSYLIVDYSLLLQLRQGPLLTVRCICSEYTECTVHV